MTTNVDYSGEETTPNFAFGPQQKFLDSFVNKVVSRCTDGKKHRPMREKLWTIRTWLKLKSTRKQIRTAVRVSRCARRIRSQIQTEICHAADSGGSDADPEPEPRPLPRLKAYSGTRVYGGAL